MLLNGVRLAAACATAAFAIGMAVTPSALAQDGITAQTVFPVFDPSQPACSPPTDLKRELVFVKDNEREFVQGIDRGLALAAQDRGIAYRVALANNDTNRMIADLKAITAEKGGSAVVAPIDPGALKPALQDLLRSGAYVGAIVPPPATTILNAPQYLTGKELADAAADYIRTNLNGKADVVLLTQDSIEFLTPRFAAMRDVLTAMPEVRIIADISPSPVSKEGGHKTMQTILLAHDKIDVVLGADGVVLGALQALREAGRERPDQFLGGIDGEPEAISEIRKGGAYKASISLNSPVFAYALGQHAADWLDGRQIPQAMDVLPRALTLANIDAYEEDLRNPGAVYADPARRESYLKMYGNICYETRANYVNFPWSSERAAK